MIAAALGLGLVAGSAVGCTFALAAGYGSLRAVPVVSAILAAGAVMIAVGWRRRLVEVVVHEGGLVVRDRRGKTERAWSQIVRVYEKTASGAEEFVFEDRKGLALTVADVLPDHVPIGRLASKLAQDGMLEGYESAARSGARLDFGALMLDDWGLHTDDAGFPWSAIRCVRWESLFLESRLAVHLTTGRGPITIASDGIANEQVVLTLLDRRGKLAKLGRVMEETAQVAA